MATAHARAADRPPPPKPEHTYSLVIFLTGVARCHVTLCGCLWRLLKQLLQAIGKGND